MLYCSRCKNQPVFGNRIYSNHYLIPGGIIAALIVLAGSVMEFGLVWNTADVLMGFMALINLPVIIILSGPALKCMQDYMRQKKEGKDPVFRASDVGLKDQTDFWN